MVKFVEMITDFHVRADDCYCGRCCVGFFPANCWEGGWAEALRWAGEDDGTLVWDRNGDGIIDDGSELFGGNTVLASGEKAARSVLVQMENLNSGSEFESEVGRRQHYERH